MHITRVELENIKSYKRATFSFQPGVTAITGENGAGKTTILEAIAWALFDVLDYKKDDFLRRGAKKGSVRVSFVSALDGRLYTVYRDTGQGYYIVDDELAVRLAERRVDVSDLLRKHLRVEPGTDLESLFRSAIGVPQGTFTADFLRPPRERKAAFDRLLKVEEYVDAAKALHDTVKLIADRVHNVEKRIAAADGQLARYDRLAEEHTASEREIADLTAMLAEARGEIEARAEVVAGMDAAERRLGEARLLAERRKVESDAATRRLRAARNERDAAANAVERQRATETEHMAHLAAVGELQVLDQQRAARDRLRSDQTRTGELLSAAAQEVRRYEDALDRAVEAGAAVTGLRRDVEAQEELERERERLRDLRASALSARERLGQIDAELATLRAKHVQVQQQVNEARAARGAEARCAQLESDRLDLETALSKLEKAATSATHLRQNQTGATREIDRLRSLIAELERQLEGAATLAEKAGRANALDRRARELTGQLANLRAEIARDRKFQREVRNGLCPILSERCLNIGEDQTLETYFRDQFASNNAQVTALEREAEAVNRDAREARQAEALVAQLDANRRQLEQERGLLRSREESLAQIDAELQALPDSSKTRRNALALQMVAIDAELKDARTAVLRYAELRPLEKRLREIDDEGRRRRDERAGVAAAAAAVAPLEADIDDTERRLAALNDPRGRSRLLRDEAAREPQLRSELTAAREAHRRLEEHARVIARDMEKFAALDLRWTEASGRRDRTLAAHLEYVANQALAATFAQREADMKQAETEAANAEGESIKAKEAFEFSIAAYDRERHSAERNALAGARERKAAIEGRLEGARRREADLAAELARLSEVRERRRDDYLELERFEGLRMATDFIRETLKEAGPHVTQSYLYNVSVEANQLFREITGGAGRTLQWTRDYDIVLEEEGHERSFQNLSGGEQMAAALSIRLALLTQLSDIRLAFFDEPTINMDAERRDRLAQQIGQIGEAENFDQLFVISHDDTFEENVDNIVHVVRESTLPSAQAEGMNVSNTDRLLWEPAG